MFAIRNTFWIITSPLKIKSSNLYILNARNERSPMIASKSQSFQNDFFVILMKPAL